MCFIFECQCNWKTKIQSAKQGRKVIISSTYEGDPSRWYLLNLDEHLYYLSIAVVDLEAKDGKGNTFQSCIACSCILNRCYTQTF